MRSRRRSSLLPGYYRLVLLLLYLPLGVLVLFSISANRTLEFPPEALTLDWYVKVFENDALLRSVRNSITVAVGSGVTATILGTMVAILIVRYDFRGKKLLIGLSIMPLIVPLIVMGVALLVLFRVAGLNLSLWSIGAGHVVVALPFTLLIVYSRLGGFDRNLEDAAMDLGATHIGTLRYVVLPIIAPAMFSALITAFTVSFDEFAIALFLAGTDPTFPVYLVGQLRFANQLPVLIALAVLVMLGTLGLLLVAERILRSGRRTTAIAE
ncbi:MAG: ABC transporter permease [Candidatus Limnocylindrales bacterium]